MEDLPKITNIQQSAKSFWGRSVLVLRALEENKNTLSLAQQNKTLSKVRDGIGSLKEYQPHSLSSATAEVLIHVAESCAGEPFGRSKDQ
jgi:hypothetical protein